MAEPRAPLPIALRHEGRCPTLAVAPGQASRHTYAQLAEQHPSDFCHGEDRLAGSLRQDGMETPAKCRKKNRLRHFSVLSRG